MVDLDLSKLFLRRQKQEDKMTEEDYRYADDIFYASDGKRNGYNLLTNHEPFIPDLKTAVYRDKDGNVREKITLRNIAEGFYPVEEFIIHALPIMKTAQLRTGVDYSRCGDKLRSYYKKQYGDTSLRYLIATDGNHILEQNVVTGKYHFLPVNFCDLRVWHYIADMDRTDNYIKKIKDACEKFMADLKEKVVMDGDIVNIFKAKKAPEKYDKDAKAGDHRNFFLRLQNNPAAQCAYCHELVYKYGGNNNCDLLTKNGRFVNIPDKLYVNDDGSDSRYLNLNQINREFYSLEVFKGRAVPVLKNAKLLKNPDFSHSLGAKIDMEKICPVHGRYFLVAKDEHHLMAYNCQTKKYMFLPKNYCDESIWAMDKAVLCCDNMNEQQSVSMHINNACIDFYKSLNKFIDIKIEPRKNPKALR